jgi:hypothetical protein
MHIAVQKDWERVENRLAAIRKNADPQYHKQQFLRLVRLSVIGPIAGAIVGTYFHFVYGYRTELGLMGNLVLAGTLAGCAASVLILLLMGLMLWIDRPNSHPTEFQNNSGNRIRNSARAAE